MFIEDPTVSLDMEEYFFLSINSSYLETDEHPKAVSRRCSLKRMLLKISKNSQENLYLSLFLIKLQASGLQLY